MNLVGRRYPHSLAAGRRSSPGRCHWASRSPGRIFTPRCWKASSSTLMKTMSRELLENIEQQARQRIAIAARR
ncbi:hypothetical protein LNO36_19590 [Klebsiella variicola subsp. variicola]|nr:hypothetical protein [Klebsiella variicola subsp. variicola]